MTLLTADEVHCGDGTVHAPGWVRIEGSAIAEVSGGAPPSGEADEVAGHAAYLLPGLVDTHCHGGGGATFATTDADEAARAAATHRGFGTTTVMASLVSASQQDLEDQVRCLVELCRDGVVAGIHLEGPWISPSYKGAHEEAVLRPPTRAEVGRLLSLADGHLRMVTLAPELPGSIQATRLLADAGVVVAVGHTAADAAQTERAINAGATAATHLYNAMPGLHHRDPGPVAALLAAPGVSVELILDGVHVDPLAAGVAARASVGGWIAVSDAMAATGLQDGEYRLGALPVLVAAGVARIGGPDGSIAGSTQPLATALRTARAAGRDTGDAVQAVTGRAARLHGLAAGDLRSGGPADLVLADRDLSVTRVMRAGAWV